MVHDEEVPSFHIFLEEGVELLSCHVLDDMGIGYQGPPPCEGTLILDWGFGFSCCKT